MRAVIPPLPAVITASDFQAELEDGADGTKFGNTMYLKDSELVACHDSRIVQSVTKFNTWRN